MQPPCPHCGAAIDPTPKSNRKCPECREPIVVRTRQGAKLLFTPAGAEQYDRDRQREVAANKARRHARNLGIDDDAWTARERELTEQHGQPPSAGDVFWGLANQAVFDAMRTSDWGRLEQLYFTMALHLRDEGRSFLDLRRESLRSAVRHHIAQAAQFGEDDPLLKVFGCRPDCDVCAPEDGRRFRASVLLGDGAPVPHDCEWCACGVRFDPAWWGQHAGAVAATRAAETTSSPGRRRGLFGRLRRS